jgi:hydrogenase expression/formation protein HypD
MKKLPDFADGELAKRLMERITEMAPSSGTLNIMEVCGTHTMEIARIGLRDMLPPTIRLLSGPGCPVCVTPAEIIDAASECALVHGATVLTFGDMIRVPGSRESLQQVKARGGRVDVVSSPLQAVKKAAGNMEQQFVFIAVGFETTIPAVALAVKKAAAESLKNLTFLVSHRLVPPALNLLANDPDLMLQGLIAPGHVSAVLGESAYAVLKESGIPAVIAGFEPLDLLGALLVLLEMFSDGTCEVRNMYPHVVRPHGNPRAVALMNEVFEPIEAHWRGIGTLPDSGLTLREPFIGYDTARRYNLTLQRSGTDSGCLCGEVLRGHITPDECPLFGRTCSPEKPVGACMVSSEGSCAAYFKYGKVEA